VSDYHVHLHPHHGGGDWPPPGEYPEGLIDRFVESALDRGLTEVGFTEHLYRCVEAADVIGPFWEREPQSDVAAASRQMVLDDRTLSLERYVEAVLDARDRGLPVKMGLEVDFFPESFESVLELIEPYPWDLLLGSVHWIGGWAVDSELNASEFERRGVDQAWADYLALEIELARRGGVDVLAHVDVCKKYGFRPESEPVELYTDLVEAAASSGVAVEVSSQGLRNPASEVYPSPMLLKMFHDAGVEITMASDAHRPDQVGFRFEDLRAAARSAGYETRLVFERRNRTRVAIERP
jgi:histidinol-phosphatase (PHP family)